MAYDGIDHISNRHRKKRIHFSGVFIVCMAFLAFIVIGLTVSLSIRACSHHKKYSQEEIIQYAEPNTETVEVKYEEATGVSISYEMPDSATLICKPKPLEGIPEQIIHKSSYLVSYNRDTKIPNWVAWHLTADHTDGPIRRMSNFYEEERVATPRATLEDYRGSGWSRGHMCPAGDNKWSKTAMYESFSLVNVCPQNASLNSGVWNSIEIDCRRWTIRFGDIYIVCGPLFYNKEHETIGVNKVVVPEAFFKVILCMQGKPKAIGFVVKNNAGTKKKDQYVNTIDEVERLTGYDFFPALHDSIEEEVEAYSKLDDWR